MVAEIPDLVKLNYSTISAGERKEAELSYLSKRFSVEDSLSSRRTVGIPELSTSLHGSVVSAASARKAATSSRQAHVSGSPFHSWMMGSDY